jgi:hypothetical protein
VNSYYQLWVIIDGVHQRYRLYVRRVGATFGDAPHYQYYQIYAEGSWPKSLFVISNVNPNTIYCVEIRSDDGSTCHDIVSYQTSGDSQPYIGEIHTDGSCTID